MDKIMRLLFLGVICLVCHSCMAGKESYTPLFKCTKKMVNPYGLCTHINRISDCYEFDTRDREIDMITSIGVSFIRTDFDWFMCQPKEGGGFSYTHHDEMMKTINDQVDILGVLTPATPRRQSGHWGVYLQNTLKQYKEKVKYWEIVNEADLVRHRLPNFDAIEYTNMLKEAYKIIKTESPNAKVLYSGLCQIGDGFFEQSLSQDAGKFFDIMNIHRYPNKDIEPEDIIDYMIELKNLMRKYNLNKSVWLTETGCSTVSKWASEDIQNKRLPRMFIITFACGIDKVFWYKTRSNELSNEDPECHFGLWHKDYSPKPAYYSYKTLIKMLPNLSTRPKLERNGDMYMASWSQPGGKRVWALWTMNKERFIRLIVDGDFKVYNIHGDEISIYSPSVKISPSIIYIVGAKKLLYENN